MDKKDLIAQAIKLLAKSLTISSNWEINYIYLAEVIGILAEAMNTSVKEGK